MPKYTVGGQEICLTRNDLEAGSYRVDSTTGEITQAVQGNLTVGQNNTVPTIYNVTATLADTEYSQALPSNTKEFIIRARGNSRLQMSFSSGQTGTVFFTIPPGVTHKDENFYSSQTVYFEASKAGETVEIIAYT